MKAIVKMLFVDGEGVIRKPGDVIEVADKTVKRLGNLVEAIEETKPAKRKTSK